MSVNRPRSSYESADLPREPELIPVASAPGGAGDINLDLQQVQEQLLNLKRQQEEIERQKNELEELKRKKHEFDEGRQEILEKLTRGLVLLERQEFEAKRELEQIRLIRENFSDQLTQINVINPAEWDSRSLASDLTKALAHIDQAKAVHNQARARLSALRSVDEGRDVLPDDFDDNTLPEKTFLERASEGLAYAFAPIISGLIFLIIYLVFHHA